MKFFRKRATSFLLAITAGILGILSRKFPGYLPPFIVHYTGDTMWAFALYFVLRMFFPGKPLLWNALVCLVLSFLVEVSQLYQAGWINAIRSTMVGALILGNSFVWTDLLCYLAGTILAVLLDLLIFQRTVKTDSTGDATRQARASG